jgi:hypothetical protein
LNDRHVRDVQNGLGFVTVFVGIAEVAVDLIVRALGTKLFRNRKNNDTKR